MRLNSPEGQESREFCLTLGKFQYYVYKKKGKGGNKMDRFKHSASFLFVVLWVAVCLGVLLIAACATAPPVGEGPVATLKGKALSKYSATAEVSNLTYMMKDSKFHIKLGLKNISDSPKRFDVSISIPEGPSAGGFYPVQKKAGQIPSMKPGEKLDREFRLYYEGVPEEVIIEVNEA